MESLCQLFLALMVLTACQAQSQIDSSRSSSSKSVATYFEVRSNPIKITTDDQYKVTLDATDTWEFSVQEGQDVTDWLVLKSDKQALTTLTLKKVKSLLSSF